MDERKTAPATEQELATMDAYWRAANYLSACQLYLLDDPLLEKPLTEASTSKRRSSATGAPARGRTSSIPTSTASSRSMTWT